MAAVFIDVPGTPGQPGQRHKAGDFDLILTDDDPDIRLDPTAWGACAVKLLPPLPGRDDSVLTVAIPEAAYTSQTFLDRSSQRSVWHIDRSFNDLNTLRAASFIGSLSAVQMP